MLAPSSRTNEIQLVKKRVADIVLYVRGMCAEILECDGEG